MTYGFGVDEHGFVCVCVLTACCLYMTEIYGVSGILVMFPPATTSEKASRMACVCVLHTV